LYSDTWLVNGSVLTPISLSQPAFPFPSTTAAPYAPDGDYPPHTVFVKNVHATVPCWVGSDRRPSDPAPPLYQVGWKLDPGESFQIRLSRDQLWVACLPTDQGLVSFIVVME
jgi:hypothetical protein